MRFSRCRNVREVEEELARRNQRTTDRRWRAQFTQAAANRILEMAGDAPPDENQAAFESSVKLTDKLPDTYAMPGGDDAFTPPAKTRLPDGVQAIPHAKRYPPALGLACGKAQDAPEMHDCEDDGTLGRLNGSPVTEWESPQKRFNWRSRRWHYEVTHTLRHECRGWKIPTIETAARQAAIDLRALFATPLETVAPIDCHLRFGESRIKWRLWRLQSAHLPPALYFNEVERVERRSVLVDYGPNDLQRAYEFARPIRTALAWRAMAALCG